MSNELERRSAPWNVVDPDKLREWLLPQPLKYYITQDAKTKEWFVCDRDLDLGIPQTRSLNRAVAIRRFYKWCNRPMPEGTTLTTPKTLSTQYSQ